MANKQVLIIPMLIGTIILVIYKLYFSSGRELGSFKDYDPNSHAQKEILVKVLHEKGISKNDEHKTVSFYVEDRNGSQMLIETALSLPQGFNASENVILKGHICGGSYELAEIELSE